MSQQKVCLAGDNWTSAHPLALQAIIEANEGCAPPYSADPWTEEASKLIQEAFKRPCKTFILPTGTGANVLALKLACRRHESVICTEISHILYKESGAAESIVGCKLLSILPEEGKATPEAILKRLKTERAFGKHSTSPGVLSITQPTEVGTVYTLAELQALSKLCKEERLLLHIDGSRLYNAAVSLKTSLHEITSAIHPDLLSLGGTKNGLMNVEALLIFNESLQEGCDYLHKQTLQLTSKTRYLSAQYVPFFKNGLWHSLADHANQKAQEIASAIKAIPGLSLNYPVETNQVFFTAPEAWVPLIQEQIFCYLWNAEKNEIRFITSWNTTEQDVNKTQAILTKIAAS